MSSVDDFHFNYSANNAKGLLFLLLGFEFLLVLGYILTSSRRGRVGDPFRGSRMSIGRSRCPPGSRPSSFLR
jgi:hypothetical protein